jgi:hypothetical protein
MWVVGGRLAVAVAMGRGAVVEAEGQVGAGRWAVGRAVVVRRTGGSDRVCPCYWYYERFLGFV